ncbi:MAG: chain-length determining protein [Bacteroides oleiciplenus]|nr:chain-length determining protein [Bacteroides oleiciplenus]
MEVWNKNELWRKLWAGRRALLMACGIGFATGVVVVCGTPEEYTASTLIVPEGYGRSSASGLGMLAGMADIDLGSGAAGKERDAIYPSLYPAIVSSTPFLVPLFDIKVRGREDSAAIPLSQYLRERQKSAWWSAVTSAPSRLVGMAMSLFRDEAGDDDGSENRKEKGTDLFRLTREEAGMAGAISSRINIGVDKKKRTIAIFVTMQDPLVAAAVADTVRARLKEYITEYRTSKARRILEYTEKLCEGAQEEYYEAQAKYTRYADANQGLVRLASRAERARLQNEMDLAQATYNQMEQQVQAARARVKKETPVYAVIQPVQVPLSPSKPRKMMVLAVCIFLSGAGSVGWVLLGKDFLRGIKRKSSTLGGDKSK